MTEGAMVDAMLIAGPIGGLWLGCFIGGVRERARSEHMDRMRAVAERFASHRSGPSRGYEPSPRQTGSGVEPSLSDVIKQGQSNARAAGRVGDPKAAYCPTMQHIEDGLAVKDQPRVKPSPLHAAMLERIRGEGPSRSDLSVDQAGMVKS